MCLEKTNFRLKNTGFTIMKTRFIQFPKVELPKILVLSLIAISSISYTSNVGFAQGDIDEYANCILSQNAACFTATGTDKTAVSINYCGSSVRKISTEEEQLAKIVFIKGDVWLKRTGGEYCVAKKDMLVAAGDTVLTAKNGFAALTDENNSVINVQPSSHIHFYRPDPIVWNIKMEFSINSPYFIAAVRGWRISC